MVLLVLSVTFLLVPDQASNRSLQVDIALYKEVLALKHDFPQSVTARTAPEEAETFCQSRWVALSFLVKAVAEKVTIVETRSKCSDGFSCNSRV